MPDLSCPLPKAIDHQEARDLVNKLRRENPGLSPATLRRQAAREMDVDYDTFLKAWKKPKAPREAPKVKIPEPTRPPVRTPDLPRPTVPQRVVHEEIPQSQLDDIETSGLLKPKPKDVDEWETDEGIVNVVYEGTQNCTQCTLAFELRRRGWDVFAKNVGAFNQIKYTDMYGANMKDWNYFASLEDAAMHIQTFMPNGSRGAIQFSRRMGFSGHIFNWEITDGRVFFYDAQIDRAMTRTQMIDSLRREDIISVSILRMDNLRIPKKAIEWVEGE